MNFKSINPFSGETLQTFEGHDDQMVEQILNDAYVTYRDSLAGDITSRAKLMKIVSENLKKERQELAKLITLEMGKPIGQSVAEIDKCASLCNYYAEHAANFLADREIETEASRSFVSFEPLGVILGIMPWNFPFWQVFRFAVPALMAGNSCLLKHASNVPQCALAIERIIVSSGFPKGSFSNLLIDTGKIHELIGDKRVVAFSLTGSERAGSKVAENAGKHIKKLVLELGGSDPFVVLEDADLDKAVKTGVKSRMINAGQSCIAAKRFIVVEKVEKEFLEKMTGAMGNLKIGDPMDAGTDIGPMARTDLVDQLELQVNQSLEAGAELILGGNRPDMPGSFYNPTLIKGVVPGMRAYEEELFGPVASVISAKDEEDAIRIANDTKYGLGASIWTSDLAKGTSLSRKIQAGCVFVNKLVSSDPRMPFGGVKLSGFGRELAEPGILEFVNQKSIWVD
ncbi:MAG: NAD-dependent succinate-semialdehyde dehydrogenase [Bacteroidetes bacterium]|nr:NAD-dependent succinate-semialdehyde dehydrogenase [Bacteroidota bacterium]